MAPWAAPFPLALVAFSLLFPPPAVAAAVVQAQWNLALAAHVGQSESHQRAGAARHLIAENGRVQSSISRIRWSIAIHLVLPLVFPLVSLVVAAAVEDGEAPFLGTWLASWVGT